MNKCCYYQWPCDQLRRYESLFLSSFQKQLKIVKSLPVVGVQADSSDVRLFGFVKLTPTMIENSYNKISQLQLHNRRTSGHLGHLHTYVTFMANIILTVLSRCFTLSYFSFPVSTSANTIIMGHKLECI